MVTDKLHVLEVGGVKHEAPARTVVVLHGILGSGRNWATIARHATNATPDVRWLLVDLRGHGRSGNFASPHTLAAAADDVRRWLEHRSPEPMTVVGHSFGGKVALRLAAALGDRVDRLVLVDATPSSGAKRGTPWRVLDILEANPGPFDSRDVGREALEAAGLTSPVAAWLTTSLQSRDGAYHWRFELPMMRALLADYAEADLWPELKHAAAGGTRQVTVLRASRGSAVSDDDWRRMQAMAEAHASLALHQLEGGHWLHVDNPQGVLARLREVDAT